MWIWVIPRKRTISLISLIPKPLGSGHLSHVSFSNRVRRSYKQNINFSHFDVLHMCVCVSLILFWMKLLRWIELSMKKRVWVDEYKMRRKTYTHSSTMKLDEISITLLFYWRSQFLCIRRTEFFTNFDKLKSITNVYNVMIQKYKIVSM